MIGALALGAFVVVVVSAEGLPASLLSLGLAAAAVALAEAALGRPEPGRIDVADPAPVPRLPVLLMNLKSGGGKAERFELVRHCRDRGIEPIVLTPGSDLLALAEDAVQRGADALGMAGGDGSQALVASVASRHGLPLVVVPAGTRNHFALDLGLDREDVVGALDAYTDGVARVVDLAEVNGRVFVNNASMGVYAKVVQSSEYRDAKVRTTATLLPDLVGPAARPLDLRFTLPSGAPATTAQLVLVSNNPYQLGGLRGAFTRPRLDQGCLGVVSLVVTGMPDAQKLAALQAVGQGRRFSGPDEWIAPTFDVTSSAPIEIGVDGEALRMDPPLRFQSRPGALTVLLPRSAVAAGPAHAAVHISSADTLAALWRVARGRPPVAP